MIFTDISLMYIRGKNNNLFIYRYFYLLYKGLSKRIIAYLLYFKEKRDTEDHFIKSCLRKVWICTTWLMFSFTEGLHLLFIVHYNYTGIRGFIAVLSIRIGFNCFISLFPILRTLNLTDLSFAVKVTVNHDVFYFLHLTDK